MTGLAHGKNVSFSVAPGIGTDHASGIETRMQSVAADVGLPFMFLSGDYVAMLKTCLTDQCG